MSDMKCSIKCPICGEMLQKYGEVDPDTGISIILGANCRKCGIRDSDIKLWQALIDTKKKLDIAMDGLKRIEKLTEPSYKNRNLEALALAVNTFSGEIIEQINNKD